MPPHAPVMFVVTEEDEAAIRAVYEQRGEFAAAIELRRRFPGITDNAQARECARTIAGWKPLPLRPVKRMPKVAAVTAEALTGVRGWREGRDPDPYFHTIYYLNQNADVRAAGLHPPAGSTVLSDRGVRPHRTGLGCRAYSNRKGDWRRCPSRETPC